nr:flagellar motor switch protein FliN [Nocardioides sp. MAH-18]
MPAPEPLAVGTVAPGDPQVAGPFASAVVADVEGAVGGRIAVLVGQELVDALASSPLGGLDIAAALQPTLDAVAAAVHSRVGAARQVATAQVVREVEAPFTVAFLHATSIAAAVLVPDTILTSAQNAELVSAAAASVEPVSVEAAVLSGAVLTSVGTMEGSPQRPQNGIELLHGVDMEVTVEIGRTRMTVRDLLELTPGAVLELDRAAGSPADLLVNGRLIARGEVVVIDEDFGLRITEIAVDAAAS